MTQQLWQNQEGSKMTKRVIVIGVNTSIAYLLARYFEDFEVEKAKEKEYGLDKLCKVFEIHEYEVPKLQEFTGLNKKRGKGKTKRWNK